MTYDPSAPGQVDAGIFGLPYSIQEARSLILPVPWDVTTSYRAGTSRGPQSIFAESPQLDLCHPNNTSLWKSPIAMLDLDQEIVSLNDRTRPFAKTLIEAFESGDSVTENPVYQTHFEQINAACITCHDYVYSQTQATLSQAKCPITLGGEHSVSLGAIKAVSEAFSGLGILQIDAHMDLRHAYEGFLYSHASVMGNALCLNGIKQLTQVGIRDYCEEELQVMETDARVRTFFDYDLKKAGFQGKTWHDTCIEIISTLPDQVYVTVDIDGLCPDLCPNTGTPVPGGLRFEELRYLLALLKESGKKMLGADLVEVGNAQWDAMVGARVLFELWHLMS